MSYVLPFNFNPSSVSVKSGSYTIPAGYYAQIVVNIVGTGSFVIDGDTALNGYEHDVLSSSVLKMDGTNTTRLATQDTVGNTPTIDAFSTSTVTPSITATFWVSEDTDLTIIAACVYTVSLYPII